MQLIVALLTPFNKRGQVDQAQLRASVLKLSAHGVDGFVPTCLEGECLYLAAREREEVHRTVLDAARGKQVYPCTWDPNPSTAAYLAESARDLGARAVVSAPPVGHNIRDESMAAWYKNLKLARVPVLATHRPHLGPVSERAFAMLRAEGLVAGLVDHSDDPFRIKRLLSTNAGSVWIGGDKLLNQAREIRGVHGVISVMANAYPQFALRVLRDREVDLQEAHAKRLTSIRQTGGVVALKSVLGYGCRAPLLAVPDEGLMKMAPPDL